VPPRLRKFALTVHVVSSAGWIGAVAAFLALAVTGLSSDDEQLVRGVYRATELITWYVLIPLSFVSLISGIVQGLGTPWGVLLHYWVVVKLVLTVVATVVLLLQVEPIVYIGGLAEETTLETAKLDDIRSSLVLHATGGLLVLLGAAVLSIYKPKGRTRRGLRVKAAVADARR
jgi:hypothetical protein